MIPWPVVLMLGLLASPGSCASFRGEVVDGAGRPMAGVLVFNAGDGPERVEVTTDDQGRFELPGLLEEACIFVDAPGYRFTGEWVAEGTEALRIALRRREPTVLRERPPSRKPVLPPDEARALARALIIGALKQTVGSRIIERETLLKELAAIDDQEALVAAVEGGEGEALVDIAAGLAMLADDFDAGLARILQANDPRQAFWGLHRLASEQMRSDPEFALTCIDAADPIWPEIPGPDAYRLVAAASLGGLLYAVDRERGAEFLKGVHDRFMPVGVTPDEVMGRARLAQEYSAVDLDASLALLAPMSADRWAGWAYEAIAQKWATIDTDRAIEIARLVPGEPERARALTQVALLIAPSDPEQALAIVKQSGGGALQWRALGDVIGALSAEQFDLALREAQALSGAPMPQAGRVLARLAYTAPPERVPELLEKALGVFVAEGPVWARTQWGAEIGRLAFVAQSVGYPEWPEIALRAASCRTGAGPSAPSGNAPRSPSPSYQLAYVLSFSDPESARHVLRSAMALDGGMDGVAPGAYPMLAAAAMQIDPSWATELIGQMAPDDLGESHGPRTDAVCAVVRCLLRPPRSWEGEMLRRSTLGDWAPPSGAP